MRIPLIGLVGWVALAVACTEPGIGTGDGAVDPSGWATSVHPCAGNRTDVLHRDDDGTLWVGCGTTTEGYGLFMSTDNGTNWAAPETTPPNVLDDWRINSIQRASDGKLYVAGRDTSGSGRVIAMNASLALEEVFVSTSMTWNNFDVGTYRQNDSGDAIAESLTGSGIAFREGATAEWQDGTGWPTDDGSYQILDLEVLGDQFIGVGSTISQPPVVFSGTIDAGLSLTPTPLAADGLTAFDGELWDVHVDSTGIIAGGANQTDGSGVVFINNGDPTTLGDWSQYDMRTLEETQDTWVRGVCRAGSTIVAVGEYSVLDKGFVALSDDGGATFALEAFSEDPPPLHRCVGTSNSLVIVGSFGWVGVAQ